MRRNGSPGSLDRLEGLALREEQQDPVSSDVISPHPAVGVEARKAKNRAVEDACAIQIGDIQGSFEDTFDSRHGLPFDLKCRRRRSRSASSHRADERAPEEGSPSDHRAPVMAFTDGPASTM
jgi:hypothetical protein